MHDFLVDQAAQVIKLGVARLDHLVDLARHFIDVVLQFLHICLQVVYGHLLGEQRVRLVIELLLRRPHILLILLTFVAFLQVCELNAAIE